MNRLFWMRLLLFIGALTITLVFLPKKNSQSLAYQEGRPWTHSLLTAPFDIPVYRDSLTVKLMRDSLDAEFLPVFRRDDQAGRDLLRELTGLPGVKPEERNGIRAMLQRGYAAGIISSDALQTLRKHNITEIRFVVNNEIDRIPISRFRTPRRIYQQIDSAYPSPEVRKAITELNLASKLTPNIVLDSAMTRRLYDDRLRPIESAIGVVQQGERIVDRGERVTPQLFTILRTYEKMVASRDFISNRGTIYFLLGELLFAFLLFAAIYVYLFLYRRRIYDDINKVCVIVSLVVLVFICAAIASRATSLGLYLVPYAILPIMLIVFFDPRTAMFCNVICVLLCAALASFPFEFIFLQICAGIVAIFTLRELTRRSQLLRTALLIFVVYTVGYFAIELLQTATISSTAGRLIGFFAINGVLISFAYVLIFVVEKVFGLISNVSLVELSDINNPLLRELSEQAPGTFNHSMSVSNLAADAARKIDANPLIVRTGALYHDIGKMKNPAFFTENQHGVNPHSALSPVDSARVIISHITEGVKLADSEKLPSVIKDMILQHHGKGLVKYFYITESNSRPGEKVDPAPFTYPGPNPLSREASLLMMADSVEAASRSLKEYTTETITELVNRIIDGQIADGLHNNSTLEFRDVAIIKEAFINRLRTIYHVRIAYPTLNNNSNQNPQQENPKQ